jgi:hypothetical protein
MTKTMVAAAWIVSAAVAVGVLAGVAASDGHAGNAYWHGSRGSDWSLGISSGGGISNWHSQPPPAPNGKPLPVPDGVAIFDRDPSTRSVSITTQTEIATMRFPAGARQYGFLISGGQQRWLTLTGRGLINDSAATQAFAIGDDGVLHFKNEARIVAGLGEKSASITILGGGLLFSDRSNGGEANVFNKQNGNRRGTIEFIDRSSAGRMTINNVGKATTTFSGRSNGGHAALANNADFLTEQRAKIDLSRTIGPGGDGRITTGKITNNAGTLTVGLNQLTVHGNFIQRDDGVLNLSIYKAQAGGITVRGTAKIGGKLVILDVFPDSIPTGRYVLISAPRGLTGRFSNVRFLFSDTRKGRIAYVGTDVVLIVERK